jgi:(hydroxyamino)benzene mutase
MSFPQQLPGGPLMVGPGRHPLDPEPMRSTKAPTVFALGLIALFTGPLVGGLVPAVIALLLARQADREAYASGGYLTGGVWIRRGVALAWIGITFAVCALVAALVVAIFNYANAPLQDFGPGID